jgi:DNA-directed RNA polymerase specialized sigma24 family protein
VIQDSFTDHWTRALRFRVIKGLSTFAGSRIAQYSSVLRQCTVRKVPARDELAGLMELAQAGDKQAYRGVLTACVPLATAAAQRAGVQEAALENVVRDVLLTVHRAMPTYEPSRPFEPWLQAIAHHCAVGALRRSGQRAARETWQGAAPASTNFRLPKPSGIFARLWVATPTTTRTSAILASDDKPAGAPAI